MRADLGAIKLPALLMRGEISKMLSPEAALDAAACLEDCELAVIPRAGHSVQETIRGTSRACSMSS